MHNLYALRLRVTIHSFFLIFDLQASQQLLIIFGMFDLTKEFKYASHVQKI